MASEAQATPEPERPVFSTLIEHAIEVSAQWHDRTYRKSRWRSAAFDVPQDTLLGVPVMAHVTAVALTVQRGGWDDETVAAAFLHDVLEDGNFWGDRMSFENLAALMGRQVANLVVFLSERKFDDKGNPIRWRERKEQYVRSLREAPAGAIAISLADKLHNLWTINEGLDRGMDVFTGRGGRKGLGAGPDQQDWFFSEVLSVSEAFTDPRLDPVRGELRVELSRFRRLAAESSPPRAG